MKWNELRIGNLVLDEDGDIVSIAGITGNSRVYHSPSLFSEIDTLSGIALTLAIVRKLGKRKVLYGIGEFNYPFRGRWMTNDQFSGYLSSSSLTKPSLCYYRQGTISQFFTYTLIY